MPSPAACWVTTRTKVARVSAAALGSALHAARALEREGRLHDAEAAYRALLARWPDLPDSWYNLARLQTRVRHFDAALASYDRALALGIAHPEEVHLNRAVVLTDHLHRHADAEAELARALAIAPCYVPAWLNLANLKEDLGARDDAVAAYERALALDPDCHVALARLAEIAAATGLDARLVERLCTAISATGTSVADAALLGFALGKLLDALADYPAAFAAYAAANQASRAMAPAGAVLYDRARQERLVDAIIATFARPVATGLMPAGPPRPLFICGMFRSGSTLLEQMLASHSMVTAGGELPFIPTLVRTAMAPFPARAAQLAPHAFAGWSSAYLDTLSRQFPGAATVTDKRPDNFLYIGLIKQLFPAARILHTRRNALDNCLSVNFLHLDHGMGYALDLLDTAHYYRQYRRLMAHWQSLYPDDILDVDYDELVRAPRTLMTRALDFCQLPWEDGWLDFHRTPSTVKTASVWQVRKPLYQSASGRWEHYAGDLAPLRAALADFL